MSEMYSSVTQLPTKIAGFYEQMRKKQIKNKEVYIALFDYIPLKGKSECLKFEKDDEFTLKRFSEPGQKWILLKHLPSGKKGFVPRNFVARLSDKQLLEWYNLDYTRDEATKRLSSANYGSGAFIVRPMTGHDMSEALAMSVKYMTENGTRILHYTISREGGQFKLRFDAKNKTNTEEITLPSLERLIKCYARFPGIQQRLTYSVKKESTIETWIIESNEIQVETPKKGDKVIKVPINGEEVEVKILGAGNFGEVFKATIDGNEVAVKRLILGRGMTKEQFLVEAEMAKQIRHEYIVKTIGICENVPYIVTEFLHGGNLKDYVSNIAPKLNLLDNLEIALKIALAMTHLAERNIVHRDLAARNILVGKTHSIIKLADFGLARFLDDAEYYKTVTKEFPFKWTAPEAYVMDGNPGRSTSASDVWSFAIVLWELFSNGAAPYPSIPHDGRILHKKLTEENYRLECPAECIKDTVYPKMRECWSLEPSERPTFPQLVAFLQEQIRIAKE